MDSCFKLKSQMNEVAQNLVAALRERFAIVADAESRRDADQHMRRLQTVSAQIDRYAAELPEPVDPQLRHFLARCSYSKALEYLESSASF